MSDDTIYLTITEQDQTVNLTVTELPPIYVNFYEVALADPRAAEARNEAIEAMDAALEAKEAAEAAALAAEQAVEGIAEVVEEEVQAQLATETRSIINALIFG